MNSNITLHSYLPGQRAKHYIAEICSSDGSGEVLWSCEHKHRNSSTAFQCADKELRKWENLMRDIRNRKLYRKEWDELG